MKSRMRLLFLGAGALALSACAQPWQPSGATGAALGAAGGAAAGQLIGGDTRSTIAGATIGAVGGGIAGSEAERQRIERERAAAQQVYGTTPRRQVIR